MFEYKVQAHWLAWNARKKIMKKKGSFLKMDFLSDLKHAGVHFYKIVKNTEEEIENIHAFHPKKTSI